MKSRDRSIWADFTVAPDLSASHDYKTRSRPMTEAQAPVAKKANTVDSLAPAKESVLFSMGEVEYRGLRGIIKAPEAKKAPNFDIVMTPTTKEVEEAKAFVDSILN